MGNLYTIIITSHNQEQYIEKCIHSVMKQSYQKLQCIVVDDGSTDKSVERIQSICKKDDRFSLICQQAQGVSAARNAAMPFVAGDFMTFLDGDDQLDLHFLEMAEKLNTDGDLYIFGIETIVYREGKIIDRKASCPVEKQFSNGQELADWYVKNHAILLYSCGNKLYRTSIVLKNHLTFDNTLLWGEDRIWNYNYLPFCNKIYSIPVVSYYYCRQNEQSLTSVFRPHHMDTLLYLHNKKIKWLKEQSVHSSKQELLRFSQYDIIKEVSFAYTMLASFYGIIPMEQYQSEKEYLDQFVLPDYFYTAFQNKDVTLSLTEFITEEVFGTTREDFEISNPEFVMILGSSACKYRVEYAYSRFCQNETVTYICCGGNLSNYCAKDGTPQKEADFLADYLRFKGIPSNRIICENQSHNTLENFICASHKVNLSSKHLYVITGQFHKNRVKSIMEKFHYEGTVLGVQGPRTRADNWFLSPYGVEVIFHELLKPYAP